MAKSRDYRGREDKKKKKPKKAKLPPAPGLGGGINLTIRREPPGPPSSPGAPSE